MSTLLAGSAILIALAAAVRSTWSPCGLSMLSTITPFTERARGHRFAVTATWFVAGGLIGGAMLGALGAVLAAGVRATGMSIVVTAAMASVLSLAAAAIDAGVFGARPPFFKRQVNDDWLRQYRPWVYGAGFGWQIGIGLATYVMTAAVILALALAALTASPWTALAIGTGFGLVRGTAVFLGAQVTGPADLRRLHQRFDQLDGFARNAVVVVELLVALILGVAAAPVFGLLIAVSGVVAILLARLPVRSPRSRLVR